MADGARRPSLPSRARAALNRCARELCQLSDDANESGSSSFGVLCMPTLVALLQCEEQTARAAMQALAKLTIEDAPERTSTAPLETLGGVSVWAACRTRPPS